MSVSGEQRVLPIWHNLNKAQVIAESPSLADKVALPILQLRKLFGSYA